MKHLHLQQQAQRGFSCIDPRVRLISSLLLLCLVVSSRSSQFPLIVAGLSLAGTLAAGMTVRTLLLRMLHPLLLAMMIILLKAVAGDGPAVATLELSGYVVSAHAGGLQEGLRTSARLLGAVSVIILLSRGMTFTEAIAAFSWLRVPRSLIEISLFAWRSLFMLYDDAGTVYTAQKTRLGYSGMRRGLRSFGTMAGMLTIRAFDSSHAMTTAMSQRGYDGTLPLLRVTPLHRQQVAGLILFAIIVTTVWSLPY